MTGCYSRSLDFSRAQDKAVVADFLGGNLTSDAGALLLREVAMKTGLFESLNNAIPDPRRPEMIVHDQLTLLTQRIMGIALGYEDLNDHQTLREDPMLQVAANQAPGSGSGPNPTLASPPTLCRLENRVDRKSLVAMSEVIVDQFIAANPAPPVSLILDFDATDDLVHGKQEGHFFNGYYDHDCFLPLYVFCENELLVSYLRPSNIDGSKHSRAVTKLLVDKLRKAWPQVKITIRGDGGFCRWRHMRWCDSNGVSYVFGLAKNPRLMAMAADFIGQAERQFLKTGEPQRVFGSFSYKAETWDRKRRVVVKVEHTAHGSNVRFIVSNIPCDPQELYEDVYCQRGNMENRIKEQQLYLFSDRTSCHKFEANQFRLLLSTAAYVLVQALRRIGLVGTELAQAQVETIRVKLFKVAARVEVSVRRVVFHLASNFPYRAIFEAVQKRLRSPAAGLAPGTG